MTQITVRWRETERTFGPDKVVRVGRGVHCDVLALDERVSRDPHLELRFENGTWVLEDRSSGGTWYNGVRVELVSVPDAHTFNLGAPDGPPLTVTPLTVASTAPPSPPTVAAEPVATSGPAGGQGHVAGEPAGDQDPGARLLAEAARVREQAAADEGPPGNPDAEPAAAPEHPPAQHPPPLPPLAEQTPPATQAPLVPPASFDPSLTVSLDDQALRLDAGGGQILVPPGHTVTLGRDPSCDLTIDSQIVSRQHARFGHDGTGWLLEDLGSTRGTFVDGRRISGAYRVAGVFEVSLGDGDAGEKVRVVTAGEHQVPRSRLPAMLAALALVVALGAAATVWWVVRDDSSEADGAASGVTGELATAESSRANTEDQLARVKAATVLIEAVDSRGIPLWTGSGTVITPDGHILTNAHVADPGAKSLDALEPLLGGLEDRSPAAGFVVWVSPDEDEPAVPRYRAEWLASSRTQDASVIRVTEDLDSGASVDVVDIEPVPIGTSDALRAGQRIHSLGYPGQATTFSISVIEGQVISVVSGDEFREMLGGDSRQVMNTNAVLGQGSSGGPVVRDGQIVGVNFTVSSFEGLDRGWVVPVDEIRPLLAEFGL
jgi:putative serine protease PepD